METTPLRRLGVLQEDGWVFLRGTGLDYLDGFEDSTLGLVRRASRRDSLSDEMLLEARNWVEQYNVHPARANVFRAFEFPPEAKVLEIGAGCGAITRYLGEQCALVDAVEPVVERVRVARARTDDLSSVQVFAGNLDDVPQIPVYDIVVVCGVLEYVGAGALADEPYLDFLQKVQHVLAPGGRLVLAIENQLGVKYLAGAPEDHTQRPFDSVEGYPREGKARTFSRRKLSELAESVGLSPRVLAAFPDYKLARVVMDVESLEQSGSNLAEHLPQFPSPDYFGTAETAAEEGLLWSTLCEAGLGAEFANSFVLVACKGGDARDLWPTDRSAVYFTPARRSEFAVRSEVKGRAGTLEIARQTMSAVTSEDLWVDPLDSDYIEGESLATHLLTASPVALVGFMRSWIELVEDSIVDDALPFDMLPHNMIVTQQGDLAGIDDEWRARGVTLRDVLRRGCLNAGLAIGRHSRGASGAWQGCSSAREVVASLGVLIGEAASGGWIDETVQQEVNFQLRVLLPGPGQMPDEMRRDLSVAYELALSRLWEPRPPRRLLDLERYVGELELDVSALRTESGELHRVATIAQVEIERLNRDLVALRAEYQSVSVAYWERERELKEMRAGFASAESVSSGSASDAIERRSVEIASVDDALEP